MMPSQIESTCSRPYDYSFVGSKRALAALCLLLLSFPVISQAAPIKEKVIIDTDIGIDIDDAFAVALALRSPDLEILGFSTASGDTVARARIIDRMLHDSGRKGIPVAAGAQTVSPNDTLPPSLIRRQKQYGEAGRYGNAPHRAAVDFIVEQVERFPGEITLIAIGPLSNVGTLIDKDIKSFRKLKRVVMMGGWINPLEDGFGQSTLPAPEYNVMIDVPAAQKVFQASGVPIFVMPLDSTVHLAMDEIKRKAVFSRGIPLTDSLTLLYHLWEGTTPILFDGMAVAFTVAPHLCPVEPMRISVDEKGLTRVVDGPPNAQVCLRSDANAFFNYFMQRVVKSPDQ